LSLFSMIAPTMRAPIAENIAFFIALSSLN